MKYLLAGLAFVLSTVTLAGGAKDTQELELRLVSMKEAQLPAEQSDLRLFFVNNGSTAMHVDRGFLDLRIQMEMMGDWVECGQMHRGTPGVRETAQWQRVDAGAELLIGLGGFWCPEDAGPVSSGRDWSEVPGDYKLKVEVSHRLLAHELERVGPVPDGAREWTLTSNMIELSVEEPSGVDAEALQWARENGHSPVSVEVATKFPTSRYAALVVWRLLTIRDGDPEQLKDYTARGFYPGRSSVPDPSSPNGQRVVSAGEDMARWRIEHGERLLREQPNFPYERDVRLSIAVSYAVLGNKEKATQLLKALAKEEGVPESLWARRFLALQGW